MNKEFAVLPAWKLNAIFKALPARKSLWHGPERRRHDRRADDCWDWAPPESPREFGRRLNPPALPSIARPSLWQRLWGWAIR
jgi:hypothetical protein